MTRTDLRARRSAFARRLARSRFITIAPLRYVVSWFLALSVAVGSAAGDTELVLTVTTRDGEVLVRAPLPDDATWRIEWTHSVAQVVVIDEFAWRSGVMYVTDQHSPYLDIAGLGTFAGRGRLVDAPSGGYHLADIDFPLHGNVHSLIIGSERAPTVLVVGGDRFELSKTHPATHARIEVTRR